jgi:hypothetical protein
MEGLLTSVREIDESCSNRGGEGHAAPEQTVRLSLPSAAFGWRLDVTHSLADAICSRTCLRHRTRFGPLESCKSQASQVGIARFSSSTSPFSHLPHRIHPTSTHPARVSASKLPTVPLSPSGRIKLRFPSPQLRVLHSAFLRAASLVPRSQFASGPPSAF